MNLWETDTGISKNSGYGETSNPPPRKKIMNCAWKAFMHLKKEGQLHHNSCVNEKIYVCFELPPTMLRQVPWNLIKIRFLISSDKFAFSVYNDIEFVGADQRSDFNWDSSLHPPSRFQIMALFIIGFLFTSHSHHIHIKSFNFFRISISWSELWIWFPSRSPGGFELESVKNLLYYFLILY